MRREHNLISEEVELNKKLSALFILQTPLLGKLFDVVLLFMIVLNTVIVVMDSIETINYHKTLGHLEAGMTFLFTVEYIV